MKTVGLIVLGMIVATVYVFDVGGARRPMDDASTWVVTEVQDTAHRLRDRVPDPP